MMKACKVILFHVKRANRMKSKYVGYNLDDEDDWRHFKNPVRATIRETPTSTAKLRRHLDHLQLFHFFPEEHRLTPEHRLPAVYDDTMDAINCGLKPSARTKCTRLWLVDEGIYGFL